MKEQLEVRTGMQGREEEVYGGGWCFSFPSPPLPLVILR
jgi:hypothetical protein